MPYCKILKRVNSVKKILFLATVLFVQNAYAADTPESVLEEILKNIKSTGEVSSSLDYVSWEDAFKDMGEEEKQVMDVSSAEDLKNKMKEVLSNPSSFLEKQMTAKLGEVPKEQQAMMQSMLAGMKGMIDQKINEAKTRALQSEYKVGKAKINGDRAQVPVTASYQGKSDTRDVDMVKRNDKWLLTSFKSTPANGSLINAAGSNGVAGQLLQN